MIATTIEQSKKLIELGLSADTADMYYSIIDDTDKLSEDNSSLYVNREVNWDEVTVYDRVCPAWSLLALIELFDNKAGIAKEYETWFAYDNGKSHCSKHFNNPLDAAFEMVCYLLENKLI